MHFKLEYKIINAFRLQTKCDCKKMNRNNALTGVILALEAIKVPTTPKSKLKIHPD